MKVLLKSGERIDKVLTIVRQQISMVQFCLGHFVYACCLRRPPETSYINERLFEHFMFEQELTCLDMSLNAKKISVYTYWSPI